jgi:uncharacterized protein (DUF2267 family)
LVRTEVKALKYDDFVAKVRERGEYADREEAERVTQLVLGVLAERLDPNEADDLAAQLPPRVARALTAGPRRPATFGVHEFLGRVAAGTGATERTAEWDSSAVLSAVAEAVSGGELNDVLTQLPSGYAALFGRPGLSG